MSLTLPLPTLTADGRVKRFSIGDRVDIVRGGRKVQGLEVLAWVSHPTTDYGLFGGVGKSAKYLLSGYVDWVYDWELELSRTEPLPAAV